MNKHDTNNCLLLVEDDPGEAKLILEALAAPADCPFNVEWVTQLSGGLELLSERGIELVLLDLYLPDSQGITTFEKLFAAAPHIPILVLSRLDDESTSDEAVRRGAQDYLLKGHLDKYTLTRALRHAIERKKAEEALFVEKERAQVTLNSIGDAVLSTDILGNITYLNLVAESMTGWSREEALGRPLAEVFQIIDGATRQPARNPLALAIQRNSAVGLTANCVLIQRGGLEFAIEDSAAPIHDRLGQVTGAVIVFHDVSAARAMTLKMSYLAQHDFLTDLPNRTLLSDRLTQAISFARRSGEQLAVLFLDLDHFKNINDSLGHAIGDKLLQSVAQRLVACGRQSDTVSRQGGDEFVILLPRIAHAADAALSAQKMLTALAAPHCINGNELQISASIGVSTYPNDGQDAESLLKSADTAMYHAKENGRNNFQYFRADMNTRAVARQSLESILRRALGRHEFLLHYQPKIDLQTGQITGVEALLRWLHPGRGLVPPLQFVPIAEECGLIVPIGQWVLREACLQLRAWLDVGLQPVSVSVNLSAVEFRAQGFLEGVRTILRETCLEPRFLEFELTESVLMNHAESTVSTLQALKALGVQFAVDDFGTGYSSLSYLRRFPIDALKLDQSFVHEISADPNEATIISAVISMGKSLKQRVIAEGVESREQRNFLRDQGCGEGQGFYFSHPVVAKQCAKLLRTGIADTLIN
jgi:diguanylate cyclase (GGDEF)-like protein/PAS domain S-box-containing protein